MKKIIFFGILCAVAPLTTYSMEDDADKFNAMEICSTDSADNHEANPVVVSLDNKKNPAKRKLIQKRVVSKKRKITPEREKGADETQEYAITDDSGWNRLPNEMQAHIVSFVTNDSRPEDVVKQLGILSLVNRDFKALAPFKSFVKTMATKYPEKVTNSFLQSCITGYHERVQNFIDAGIDVNLKDQCGRSALSLALINGHEDIAQLLIQHKAYTRTTDYFGLSPLHYAAVKRCYAVIDMISGKEHLPEVFLATMKGDVEKVKQLIEAGENVSYADSAGVTPIMIALNSDNQELATILMNANPVVMPNTQGITPLEFAAIFGNIDLVNSYLIYESNAIVLKNALMEACCNGHKDVVQLLLHYGAHVNGLDKKGRTPLMCAALLGHQSIVELLLSKLHEQSINRRELDINAQDNFGQTALILAIEHNRKEIAQLLLAHDASDMTRDDFGLSGFHYAAAKRRLTQEESMLLAKISSSPQKATAFIKKHIGAAHDNKFDVQELTALSYACMTGNDKLARYLLENGENVKSKRGSISPLMFAACNGHASTIELLLEHGAQFQPKLCGNALIAAANKGYEAVVKLLLSKGVKPDYKDQKNRSALTHAAINGHTRIVQLLLSQKTSMNATDKTGFTPILHAVEHGHADIVELLIKKSASVNILDGLPFWIALDHNDEDIFTVLFPKLTNETLHELAKKAIITGNVKILSTLFKKKLITKAKFDFYGALCLAAKNNNMDMAQWLLANGANINANKHRSDAFRHFCRNKGTVYFTALMHAIKKSHHKMTEFLLQQGADPNIEAFGKTAFSIASSKADTALINLLLTYGVEPIILQ